MTIPVIVRLGNLQATAGIANVHLEQEGRQRRSSRSTLAAPGARSTFGEVRVLKAGVKDPIAVQKAVAVYTEIGKRHVSVPAQRTRTRRALAGPVTVQYLETFDDGTHVLAETQAVLR